MPGDIVVRRVGETVTVVRVRAESHQDAMRKLWAAINDDSDRSLWQFYLHSSFTEKSDGWWEGQRRV